MDASATVILAYMLADRGALFAVIRCLAIVHHSHGDTECACLLSDIHLASANIVD
jgi:hypothetical protein